MKQINYFLATIMIALIPMLVSSCKPKNAPDSIVGKWELTEASRVILEIPEAGSDLNDLVGQVWDFDANGKLVVGKDACDYTLSGTTLSTTYAKEEPYQADFFVVQTCDVESLVLTATHEKKDKVGAKRTYVVTLKFVRVVE
jgi:hypothetical protein